ncbi:hypothetical protein DL96DRAFT_1618372 [Flagelloscypha sp. PMI_526]|nr:hypothetical protein DL96DRAFT_1618372 [Flagelloscypha sp. PMI_526]
MFSESLVKLVVDSVKESLACLAAPSPPTGTHNAPNNAPDFNKKRPTLCNSAIILSLMFLRAVCGKDGGPCQTRFNSLYVVLARLISTKWTPSQMDAYSKKFQRCRCRHSSESYHFLHVELPRIFANAGVDGEGGLPSIIMSVSEMLSASLREVRRSHRDLRNLQSNQAPLWPRNDQEFLPFGPHKAIEAYCAWIEVFLPHPLRIIGEAAPMFPVLTDAVLDSEQLIESTSEWMAALCLIIEDNQPPSHDSAQYWAALDCYAVFVKGLNDAEGHRGLTYVVETRRSHFKPMLETLVPLSAAFTARFPFQGTSQKRFRDLVRITRLFQTELQSQLTHPDDVWVPGEFEDEEDELLSELYEELLAMEKPERCMAPGCTASGKLLRCAVCRITWYCSRDCQKLAYKFAKAPHKTICPTLKNLYGSLKVIEAGIEDPNLRKAAFQELDCELDEIVILNKQLKFLKGGLRST